MGTLIEDIIAPGVGSVIKSYFSNEPDYMAVNVKRKNRESGIAGEFDIIASNDIQVFLIETRSYPKKQHIDELICEKRQRFRDLFPEYGHLELVLILASLRFDPELVAYASQRRVIRLVFVSGSI